MTSTTEQLLTQTEARAEARRLNSDYQPGMPVAIAVPVPFNSWGGQERGWAVAYTLAGVR